MEIENEDTQIITQFAIVNSTTFSKLATLR